MNMLSFLGETPSKALQNALHECGEDAIVISTKKISDKSNGMTNMYEVVVAIEEGTSTPKPSTPSINKDTKYSPSENLSRPQEYSNQFDDFKDQIMKMQEAITQVQKSMWEPKSQLFDLTIPLEFADVYKLFQDNEFDEKMTYTILKKTITQLPLKLRTNQKKINDFFKLILRRIIPIKHEVPLNPKHKKIMMMVGPTGVGKTTTIAKLAARYAYKLGQNYKVGIITLDSFRVGAIEQLNAYTNIMRLPLEIVKNPEEIVDALIRLKDCNYILIDTAGSSQYDVEKIELINDYQKKIEEVSIEKILVLPSNVKQSDLQEIYDNYSLLGIDYLTFTKLDETRSFGNLISFAHKTKKSITYLSIGQNVPDDLMVADASFLIDCFMNKSSVRI